MAKAQPLGPAPATKIAKRGGSADPTAIGIEGIVAVVSR
jgi:hypothetical protein